ncbi:hypothetical protein LCGC14_2577480, partial [marine sediment metagenome]
MTTTEHQVPVAPLPEPVEAGSVLVPDRKPRWRRAYRKWDTARTKELWLRIYKVTGNAKVTTERVGIKLPTFHQWKTTDADFRGKLDILNVMWSDLLTGRVVDLAHKAYRVLELKLDMALEDGAKIDASTVDIAMALLKSQGKITDKSTVEHTGKGGGPI